MARSPLFRTVRRLMRRAHAANMGGSDQRRGPTRRDVFLGALGAAALVPLAGACGDNTKVSTSAPGIAIIGGGIAGLTAAHFLRLAGIDADVYEASMRIGGRMYTDRDTLAATGQLVELGGELIDTDHLVIPALAETYGLPLDDLPAATAGLAQDSFFFDGAMLDEAVIVAAFMPVAAKMDLAVMAGDANDVEFARIDNLSIREWLHTEAGLATDDLIVRLLEVAYLEEFGLEVYEQSAWNLITLIDYANPDPFHVFGDSDERFHTHDGNDAIPQAIAAELGDAAIHLDHRLTKVATTADGFALTFSTINGDHVIQAAHVVYALPFTKLREVDLSAAGMSADKLTIIDELGYGTNAKLMMQFSERHWEIAQSSSGSVITDVGDLQTTWATTRGQAGAQGVLTNFVGGARGVAIGEGSAESQAQMVLPWIDTVFPGTAAKYIPGTAIRQHWPSYEFTKGSYASYKKGQWAFFGKEGAREGNQHFCGEHCSEDYQGYMEGGAETGAMVAAEICDDLGVDQPAVLVALLAQLVQRPRGSYHAGFGERMKLSEIRGRRL